MVQMRALRAGGGSVTEHYLASQKEAPIIVELKQAVQKIDKTFAKQKAISWERRFQQHPFI